MVRTGPLRFDSAGKPFVSFNAQPFGQVSKALTDFGLPAKVKLWDIWAEGYCTTGEQGGAVSLTKENPIAASNFDEAVQIHVERLRTEGWEPDYPGQTGSSRFVVNVLP
ncbi:hypothetical protein AYX22_14150 [Arthrobacter sp. D5-1]|nr:hypothetical protein AYX22_14150 [Arthrobacter sp. D5-1]